MHNIKIYCKYVQPHNLLNTLDCLPLEGNKVRMNFHFFTLAILCFRDKPSSPKFIVTLDGANSDMEDKYDDQVKKEKKKRRSKKKTEVDDYEVIDTSDVREKGQPAAAAEMSTPEKPVIKQITFDLDVEGEFE